MDAESQERVYQRIGEFAVGFQWLEDQLRQIGWFILDPSRSEWPPQGLRDLTNFRLVNEVHRLFTEALPKCRLGSQLEAELLSSFTSCVATLHRLRESRNRILHSAYIELKAGGEVVGLMRSDPRLQVDDAGKITMDQELLSSDSFGKEMEAMAYAGLFLGRAYKQLIHRYPHAGA